MTGEARPTADDVLVQALKAGPIYAGPESPWWDALWRLSRQGKCRGEFVPFDGWMWTR